MRPTASQLHARDAAEAGPPVRYESHQSVPRDLRTASELAAKGYPVPGEPAAELVRGTDVVPLFSTTHARRLRGDFWPRPRGTRSADTGASARPSRSAPAGPAAGSLRAHFPLPRGRYRRPALSRDPVRWLTELFKEGFVVIDVETTGLARHDEVIEVAAIDSDGATVFESLVRPRLGRVPPASSRVHGLHWTDVAGAPTWAEIVDSLADVITGRRVLAWNASFDERLVKQSSKAWSIEHPLPGFECAMRAYSVCRGVAGSGLRLQRAAEVEGVLVGRQAHRGGHDAALTLAVLKAVHIRRTKAA